MVLNLLQVLGCSILMDLRNRATHFAFFRTVSKFKISFLPPKNNWCYHDNNKVATRTKRIFRQSLTIRNCMQNLRGFKICHFPLCLTVTENCC